MSERWVKIPILENAFDHFLEVYTVFFISSQKDKGKGIPLHCVNEMLDLVVGLATLPRESRSGLLLCEAKQHLANVNPRPLLRKEVKNSFQKKLSRG